jgi:hypothetical protein
MNKLMNSTCALAVLAQTTAENDPMGPTPAMWRELVLAR